MESSWDEKKFDCYQCNGTGFILDNLDPHVFKRQCLICYGTGKLDWVDIIVPKSEPNWKNILYDISKSTKIPIKYLLGESW
jgi:RecJ-like exonuclease